MSRRMSRRTDGSDSGQDLSIPLVSAQTLHDIAGEHAPDVLEPVLHARFGRPAHLVIIEPKLMLTCGHQDLGVWERKRSIGAQKAIDVVAMIVGDDDGIDLRRIELRAGKRRQHSAVKTISAAECRLARPTADRDA